MSAEPRAAAPATVTGRAAVVAAGHELAAATALDVLRTGGNAADAAVAASAVQCVVELPWCGVGGDAFVLVRSAQGSVDSLNGSGAAPAAIDGCVAAGDRVPRFGPLSVAVPGTVAAWAALTERYGSWPLDRVLADAVAYAADGFPLYARLLTALQGLPGQGEGALHEALAEGNRLTLDAPFRQPALAQVLARIGGEGPGGFYAGPPAGRIAVHLARGGGVMSEADLAGHDATWATPLSTPYRGWTVHTQQPVSMGCLLLAELAVLAHFDLSALEPGSPAQVDLLVRSTQAVFEGVLPSLGDPDGRDLTFDDVVSPDAPLSWAARIRNGMPPHVDPQAMVFLPEGDDTTSLAVTDSDGMTVALVHSLFNEFGSRVLVPGTGVLLNDRLANLVAEPARPNGLRGGRRPIHTLHCYVAEHPDGSVVAGATPGGRGQVQTNLQVLVDVIDHGDDVQRAVDRPRWVSGRPRRFPPDDTLYVEPGLAGAVDALERRGHAVQVLAQGAEDNFGSCTVVAVDGASRQHHAAADRRRDAAALGW